jgi:hypothetical protein
MNTGSYSACGGKEATVRAKGGRLPGTDNRVSQKAVFERYLRGKED